MSRLRERLLSRVTNDTKVIILLDACPFCTLPVERIRFNGDAGLVIRDAFPISPGHTLIIPRRHTASFFELAESERRELFDLLEQARADIDNEFSPDGYNIGINDGAAAGQTVPHVHIHLIPRYEGDVTDTRGGVRWIVLCKADYWSAQEVPMA